MSLSPGSLNIHLSLSQLPTIFPGLIDSFNRCSVQFQTLCLARGFKMTKATPRLSSGGQAGLDTDSEDPVKEKLQKQEAGVKSMGEQVG